MRSAAKIKSRQNLDLPPAVLVASSGEFGPSPPYIKDKLLPAVRRDQRNYNFAAEVGVVLLGLVCATFVHCQ